MKTQNNKNEKEIREPKEGVRWLTLKVTSFSN